MKGDCDNLKIYAMNQRETVQKIPQTVTDNRPTKKIKWNHFFNAAYPEK